MIVDSIFPRRPEQPSVVILYYIAVFLIQALVPGTVVLPQLLTTVFVNDVEHHVQERLLDFLVDFISHYTNSLQVIEQENYIFLL